LTRETKVGMDRLLSCAGRNSPRWPPVFAGRE
jgi:hypothetical protein